MKTGLSRISAVMMAFIVFSASAIAQTDTIRAAAGDKFVISAKAGGINAVVGDVSMVSTNGRSSRLIKGDSIEIGDKVSTGADGKAEILMNPGSYLRLGANSSFEFESTDLDDLRIRMHRGSAMFEVFASEDFVVNVDAGQSKFKFVESGIYRLDVTANGSASVEVFRGLAQAGTSSSTKVKGGRRAEFTNGNYAVVKFDRGDKDDLEQWSSDRAKQLSKISSSLKRDQVRDPLISSFYGGRWNMYNSFGLWVYDPFWRSFCFLPFGYGWSSPYGHWFGRPIWYYNLPSPIYNQPPPTKGPRDRSPRMPAETISKGVRDRSPVVPPYQKVGGDRDGGGRGRGDVSDGSKSPSVDRRIEPLPRISPSVEPIFSPPVISIPRGEGKKP